MTLLHRLHTHLTAFPALALFPLLVTIGVTILLWVLSGTLGLLGFLVIIFMLATYGDPVRPVPDHHGLTLAAGDGVITLIRDQQGLPLDFEQAQDQREHFMTITVAQGLFSPRHIRAPIAGEIVEIIEHTPQIDDDEKDFSLPGDQSAILFRDDQGQEMAIVIRGFIIPHQIWLMVSKGQRVQAGDRIGLILGIGAVDHVVLTTNTRLIDQGSFARAGETVLTGAYAHAKHRAFKHV